MKKLVEYFSISKKEVKIIIYDELLKIEIRLSYLNIKPNLTLRKKLSKIGYIKESGQRFVIILLKKRY